jgi:tripartite-type tricarboxylate transporter receptor subunit TctC
MLFALNLTGCTGPENTRTSPYGHAFFKGKTMTYIVAGAVGGNDTYGRLVSKYLGKHLGLNKVVVRNIPSGGIAGVNEISVARPDGLTLGTFSPGSIYQQLLQFEGVQFDLRQLSWIGKAGDDPRLFIVSKKSGFRSFDDLRKAKRPLLLGTGSYGSAGFNDAVLLAYALGLPVRFVFGLSTGEAQLSMMRGEIDGEIASASSYRSFVNNKYGYTVMRVGRVEGADESIPDANELVTTEDGKTAVAFVRSLGTLLRWTAGPPGIPEDILSALRNAYMAALGDPALLSEARRLDVPIAPMDGATLAKEIERVLAQSPPTLARIASIIGVDPASVGGSVGGSSFRQ